MSTSTRSTVPLTADPTLVKRTFDVETLAYDPVPSNANKTKSTPFSKSPTKTDSYLQALATDTQVITRSPSSNEEGEELLEDAERTFYEHFRDESISLRKQLRHELTMIFLHKKSSGQLFTRPSDLSETCKLITIREDSEQAELR